jgi:hypothetical protein
MLMKRMCHGTENCNQSPHLILFHITQHIHLHPPDMLAKKLCSW